MLLVEHLFLAALITLVLRIGYKAVGEDIPDRYFLVFGAGMLGVNILDVDHYNGSISVLLSCALIISRSEPLFVLCGEQLRRGFAHSYLFLGGLGAGLLYLYHFIRSEMGRIAPLFAMLGLGIWAGWLVHLYVDFSFGL